jgi:hypothetical protein
MVGSRLEFRVVCSIDLKAAIASFLFLSCVRDSPFHQDIIPVISGGVGFGDLEVSYQIELRDGRTIRCHKSLRCGRRIEIGMWMLLGLCHEVINVT